MTRSPLGIAALSLSLVGLASIPILLTTELDFGEYAEIQVELRHVSELHKQLNEQVLSVRVGIAMNYDALVDTQHLLESEAQRVADLLEENELTERAEVAAARSAYLAESRDQRELVEVFKSRQSVLQNSHRYLPVVGRAALEAYTTMQDAGHFSRVLDLETQILGHLLTGGDPERLRHEISVLSADLTHDHETHALAFLRHAVMALESRALVDQASSAVVGHAVHASLQRLNEAHDAARGDIERQGQLARGLLFGLSLGLIGFVGVVLLKLQKRSDQLAQTNEGLEETIRERSAMLAQSQKLESIGQLAAGIAHEINTPAQYVGDNLAFLETSFAEIVTALGAAPSKGEPDEELAFLLEEIPAALRQSREGVARVAEIVRAMKEFSHPGSDEPCPIDLNNAVRNTVTVTRNNWKDVATLDLDLDDALPEVHCLAAQINQAVLNLIVNAADAIREQPNRKGLGHIQVSTRCDGDHVQLVIRDNGPGVPDEIQRRVFDPFFTTKGVGKGTGQGLAITRSIIVEKHAGTVELESQPGAGATFRIRLPLTPPAREAAPPAGPAAARDETG